MQVAYPCQLYIIDIDYLSVGVVVREVTATHEVKIDGRGTLVYYMANDVKIKATYGNIDNMQKSDARRKVHINQFRRPKREFVTQDNLTEKLNEAFDKLKKELLGRIEFSIKESIYHRYLSQKDLRAAIGFLPQFTIVNEWRKEHQCN